MTTTPWPKAIGFFHRLLLTEHCTDPVCALQTHAYGFQMGQVAAYQDCSHPASVCLVDHVLHGDCTDVKTLGSKRRTVAYYTRGE